MCVCGGDGGVRAGVGMQNTDCRPVWAGGVGGGGGVG